MSASKNSASVYAEDNIYEKEENLDNEKKSEKETTDETSKTEVISSPFADEADGIADYYKFEHIPKLREDIVKAVFRYGFETPSPIQRKAIAPILEGRDVIAQAQSGMGKTGAFSIAALGIIDVNCKQVQVVILTPTRELASQVFAVASGIAKDTGVRCMCCMGGTDQSCEVKSFESGTPLVVATPGRLIAHLGSSVNKSTWKLVVIDEADEMFNRGFRDQIKHILEDLNCQIAVFSATLPEDSLKVIHEYVRDPVVIAVDKERLTLDGIKQYYVFVEQPEHKSEVITDIYNTVTVNRSIIYCNSKNEAMELQQTLENELHCVSLIHGDLPMRDRELHMKKFRTGSTRTLISTDLLARGIDVQQVSLVVNYSIPQSTPNYIHRIGRSGRYGRKGIALNLVTGEELRKLREIEDYYQTEIAQLPSNYDKVFQIYGSGLSA